jgi:uncharacterized SAM-binding protein YcdF (DUF218 family)
MNKIMFKFISKLAVVVLLILGLIELGLALWTVLENRYKSLAYNLADVGYIVSFVDRNEIQLSGYCYRIYGYYDIYPCVYLLLQ